MTINSLNDLSKELIANQLKFARNSLNLTLKQVSDRLGFAISTLSDIERGKRQISSIELYRFSKLYGRMVNALNTKHIDPSQHTTSCQIRQNEEGEDIVRGRITADIDSEDSVNTPLIIIDGKQMTWKEFGRMIMTYEGANFKLQLFDPYDEIA